MGDFLMMVNLAYIIQYIFHSNTRPIDGNGAGNERLQLTGRARGSTEVPAGGPTAGRATGRMPAMPTAPAVVTL